METQDKSLDQAGEAVLKESAVESVSPVRKHALKDSVVYRWFLTALVSIAMAALAIFVYDRYFTQKIVSLDIKGFIAEQRDLYLAGKINDEQFRASLDRLEAKVKSIPGNQVVIMGDAVVKNAEIVKP